MWCVWSYHHVTRCSKEPKGKRENVTVTVSHRLRRGREMLCHWFLCKRGRERNKWSYPRTFLKGKRELNQIKDWKKRKWKGKPGICSEEMGENPLWDEDWKEKVKKVRQNFSLSFSLFPSLSIFLSSFHVVRSLVLYQ